MLRCILATLAIVICGGCALPPEPPAIQTVTLAVNGRIGHMAWDSDNNRLWLAALGNNTVEILNFQTLLLPRTTVSATQPAGLLARRIPDIPHPQSIVTMPALYRIAVVSAGDGMLRIFDSRSMDLLKQIPIGDDADNVRFDPAATRLYVGYGNGALAVVDPVKGEKTADIKLPAHPESFQLETAGKLIFVNIPDAHEIAVVDRTTQSIIHHWKLEESANFPMALDEVNHRLFTVTRNPAKLIILDMTTGQRIAALDCSGDCDDIFYTPVERRLYLSCGQGFIDIITQADADHYALISKISTAPGARTSLYLPLTRILFLAVAPRHRGDQPSELRIYQISQF